MKRLRKGNSEKWKQFISIWSRAAQEGCFGAITETDGKTLGVRLVFQLARFSGGSAASRFYAARTEDTKRDARKGEGVKKQGRVAKQKNQPFAEIVRRSGTDLL